MGASRPNIGGTPFWQVPHHFAIIREHYNLGPHERLVYYALCERSDMEGTCYPAMETIAKDTALSTRSVRRAIKALSDMGIIEVEKRYSDSRQTSNLYYLVPLEALLDAIGIAGVSHSHPALPHSHPAMSHSHPAMSHSHPAMSHSHGGVTVWQGEGDCVADEQESSNKNSSSTTTEAFPSPSEESCNAKDSSAEEESGEFSPALDSPTTTTTVATGEKPPANSPANGSAQVDIRKESPMSKQTKQAAQERVARVREWVAFLDANDIDAKSPRYRDEWLNLLALAERDYELLKLCAVEATRKNDYRRFQAGPTPEFVRMLFEEHEAAGTVPGVSPERAARIDIGQDDPSLRAYRIDIGQDDPSLRAYRIDL